MPDDHGIGDRIYGSLDDGARVGRVDLEEGTGPQETLRFVTDPPFEHDVQRRIPSVEKAKRVLGFAATTTLDEMLDEVIPRIRNAREVGLI